MKELSTIIRVHHLGLNKDYEFFADKFTFEPTASDNDAGMLYDCSLTKTIELPEADTLLQFYQPQSCIVTFTDSAGSKIKEGSTDIPARVSINPYLSSAQIVIDCRQIQSPYLM